MLIDLGLSGYSAGGNSETFCLSVKSWFPLVQTAFLCLLAPPGTLADCDEQHNEPLIPSLILNFLPTGIRLSPVESVVYSKQPQLMDWPLREAKKKKNRYELSGNESVHFTLQCVILGESEKKQRRQHFRLQHLSLALPLLRCQ